MDLFFLLFFNYQDPAHRAALIEAQARGIQVRVIMHTSSCSSCSRCDQLREGGVSVRFVTPTMHHKFAIFDYASLEASPKTSSKVASGSCNWSYSAATKYDESWFVFSGATSANTIKAYKQEFEWLWAHSRPCGDDPADVSGEIDSALLEPRIEWEGCFTSYNMKPRFSSGKWGFSYLKNDNYTANEVHLGECTKKMTDLIKAAERSVRIAHTYFRMEPVFQAIKERMEENPSLEVFTIHDGKEYLVTNPVPQKLDSEGADVRYKYYARKWKYTCSKMMHNKFILIDAELGQGKCRVVAGSENLSETSEKRVFENIAIFSDQNACDKYKKQFDYLHSYGKGALPDLKSTATCFFDPIALNANDIISLRSAIDARVDCFDSSRKDTCPGVKFPTVEPESTPSPTTASTSAPTPSPTKSPTASSSTAAPTSPTKSPTASSSTAAPTSSPTASSSTSSPTSTPRATLAPSIRGETSKAPTPLNGESEPMSSAAIGIIAVIGTACAAVFLLAAARKYQLRRDAENIRKNVQKEQKAQKAVEMMKNPLFKTDF